MTLEEYRRTITASLPRGTSLSSIIKVLSKNLKISNASQALPDRSESLHSWLREDGRRKDLIRLVVILGQTRSDARDFRDNRREGDNRLTAAGTSDGIAAIYALTALAQQPGLKCKIEIDAGLDEWLETAHLAEQGHIIVIGTGDVNLYAAYLHGLVHRTHFGMGDPRRPQYHTHYQRVTVDGHTYNRNPQDISKEQHFGVIALLRNPWNPEHRLLWVAGTSGIATTSGCRLLGTSFRELPFHVRNSSAVVYEGGLTGAQRPRAWLVRYPEADNPMWVTFDD